MSGEASVKKRISNISGIGGPSIIGERPTQHPKKGRLWWEDTLRNAERYWLKIEIEKS